MCGNDSGQGTTQGSCEIAIGSWQGVECVHIQRSSDCSVQGRLLNIPNAVEMRDPSAWPPKHPKSSLLAVTRALSFLRRMPCVKGIFWVAVNTRPDSGPTALGRPINTLLCDRIRRRRVKLSNMQATAHPASPVSHTHNRSHEARLTVRRRSRCRNPRLLCRPPVLLGLADPGLGRFCVGF